MSRTELRIDPPKEAVRILDRLEEKGFPAYLVGGCIRDSLLGRTPEDWDICTAALPGQVTACFPGLKVLPTGLAQGTVTLLVPGENAALPYEITTFRADGVYSDHRRPASVEFVSSLQTDLSRRDFTVNAMAYSPLRGLSDPFDGIPDLRAGVIRCVGKPTQRFREDALRILRAFRFAAVLGFSLEAHTLTAGLDCCADLRRIAPERVQRELRRMLPGQGIAAALESARPVLGVWMPELSVLPDWSGTLKALAAAPPDEVIRLTLLLRETGAAPGILRRLRFDRETAGQVIRLVALSTEALPTDPAQIKRLLAQLDLTGFRQLLFLKKALCQAGTAQGDSSGQIRQTEEALARILREKQCFSLRDLAVSGQDLLDLGIPKGPRIGELLRDLLDLVTENPLLNQRAFLLSEAKKQKEGPSL